jgi:hypothetical protein
VAQYRRRRIGQVLRSGEEVNLAPKTFELLLHFALASPEVAGTPAIVSGRRRPETDVPASKHRQLAVPARSRA